MFEIEYNFQNWKTVKFVLVLYRIGSEWGEISNKNTIISSLTIFTTTKNTTAAGINTKINGRKVLSIKLPH